MVTKIFKAIVASLLEAGASEGYIAVKDITGASCLLAPYFSASEVFPYASPNTVQFGNYSGGVFIGTGDTAPTEDDYNLASRITSGVSASSTVRTTGKDADGNLYIQLVFTLTNTTSSDIIVKEVGYVQNMRCGLVNNPSVLTNYRLLLDRTVLPAPVTIPANNGTAAIKYILKTIIS